MMPFTPAPGIQRINTYAPTRSSTRCDIDLSGTEAGDILPMLAEPVPAGELLRAASYPDTRALAESLGSRILPGLPTIDQILVTAGADDALDRACRAMLSAGRSAIVTNPTFEMIPRYATLAGAELRAVSWPSGELPADEIIALADERTTLVAIVSPNNPTGAVASIDAIRQVHEALPSALILVDLAYVEFADEDITADALALPRIVVTRTLSKAWGLPGLRVGYAIGTREVVGWMQRAGGPYPVSAVSVAIAQRALSTCADWKDANVRAVRRNRARLAGVLESLGTPGLPSQANFVTIAGDRARFVYETLAASGIATRLLPGSDVTRVRITVPTDDVVYERLERTLRSALASRSEGSPCLS